MKSKEIKLPFGLNENNTLVHITDVERGKKCACFCPSPACQSPLIAAKGSKNQPHFKHAVVNECEGGLETAIHLAAKQEIMKKKKIILPEYISTASATDSKGKKYTESKLIPGSGKDIHFDSVQEEVALHGMKADILAKKDSHSLIIEIFYRHKVDDQKLAKIASANISAIEIDLSDLAPEEIKDWEAFWSCINDPQRITWLHNAKAPAAVRELENRLAIKIEKREKEYQQEEHKKQRQEEKEKEQLLHALDDLKIINSKEDIAIFKQEAEMHSRWKYYADKPQYLPFSLYELPDFIDVDVPNGDWVFGCDRRIWQIAFYSYFIWKKGKSFCVKMIDDWLQNTARCKVPWSVKAIEVYGRRYPKLVPLDIRVNRPSSWRTLKDYFNYLCDLGMLEFSGEDYHNPGNDWFRVISKYPKESPAQLTQL